MVATLGQIGLPEYIGQTEPLSEMLPSAL